MFRAPGPLPRSEMECYVQDSCRASRSRRFQSTCSSGDGTRGYASPHLRYMEGHRQRTLQEVVDFHNCFQWSMAVSTTDRANCPRAREDPRGDAVHSLVSTQRTHDRAVARNEAGGSGDMRSRGPKHTANWNGIWGKHAIRGATGFENCRRRSRTWIDDPLRRRIAADWTAAP